MSTVESMNITSKTTKSDLERELRRVTALANDNHNALESFKNRVYEVALENKDENDWCDEGFTKAMADLGIKLPAQYRLVTITVPVNLTDPKGPTAYELEYVDEADDQEIVDAVIEALASNGYNQGYQGHTVKVETLDEEPETLFQEKPRVSAWGSTY